MPSKLKHFNNDFSNLCKWFLDNKLSIHFGEDKTKSILCGTECKLKKVGKGSSRNASFLK